MRLIKIVTFILIFLLFINLISPCFYKIETTSVKAIKIKKESTQSNKNIGIIRIKIKIIDTRFVIYSIPNTSPPKQGYPILFLFHGAAQHCFSWFFKLNIWNKAQRTFTESALKNGYFIVSFESLKPIRPGPRAWDAFEQNISKNNDIIFVKNVINWLKNSSLSVNINNIYCTGFSSGAFFCSRLAQSYNYSFKAMILNSGCNADCISITDLGPIFNFSTGFNISDFHPPTLLIHGKKDGIVPFNCSLKYYHDLKDNNINVTNYFDELGKHIWLKKYNKQIIEWMKNQK